MRRVPNYNPKVQGMLTQTLDINDTNELDEWKKTIMEQPTAGLRNYVRWITPRSFEIGVEPVDEPKGAKPVKDDGLDAMTDIDLKTIAGKVSANYADNPSRGELVARIRAKNSEKRGTK